jgi:hypothetical protein
MSSVTLQSDCLRLTFEVEAGSVARVWLDVRADGDWRRMAETCPVSRMAYRDKAGQRQEIAWAPQVESADARAVLLRQALTDNDGVAWRLAVDFRLTDDPRQAQVDYRLEASESRGLLNWVGPSLLAGQGSFGAAKTEALFPGLEYLLGDEPSSDTAFAAEKYANRTIPHPYKISVPLMAVGHAGAAVGLLWDANQEWHSAWRHPAALFSSPNRIQPGADNHWMALCAPAVEPRWRNETELEAHAPCSGRLWTLSARLAGLASGGVMGVLKAWVAAYGLPSMPCPVEQAGPASHSDFVDNVDLCARSYLDVAWDEAAEGWHHTLSDPWGPQYQPNLANQLWRYGRWPGGDPLLRARARDQVRRATRRILQRDARAAPPLELAMLLGQTKAALGAMTAQARQAAAEQSAGGAWLWKPDVLAVPEFKTEDRVARMGRAEDSSSGFTASRARSTAALALTTGDPQAAAATLRAADWCNGQTRPEGAQTWELHLHVPDVLAVPYLIDLNLAAHDLTGDCRYLDAAAAWAWTGLPFTYLWSGYYRPVMRYGTIPVFGVTFHDVQSWFGVIVQWNGLVYASALRRLAERRPVDGPIDWRALAEGIVRHGMQEQIRRGPYCGMYPDAFSAVRGDEEYTWWLNPQLIGENTFPMAGLPVDSSRRVLRDASGRVLRLTSGAAVEQAEWSGARLRAVLRDWPGETSWTLIGARGTEGRPLAPVAVSCEGAPLKQVDDVDRAEQGWQWLPEHGVAVAALRAEHGAAALTVDW